MSRARTRFLECTSRAAPTASSSNPGYDTVMPSLAHFFPLAVDFQHSSSFAKWVSRGMNTVIRVPFNIEPLDTVANWTAKANELGLKVVCARRAQGGTSYCHKSLI